MKKKLTRERETGKERAKEGENRLVAQVQIVHLRGLEKTELTAVCEQYLPELGLGGDIELIIAAKHVHKKKYWWHVVKNCTYYLFSLCFLLFQESNVMCI